VRASGSQTVESLDNSASGSQPRATQRVENELSGQMGHVQQPTDISERKIFYNRDINKNYMMNFIWMIPFTLGS
jgi:hypothetical protein